MNKNLSYFLLLASIITYPLIGEENTSQPASNEESPLEHFIAGKRAPSLFEKLTHKNILAQEETQEEQDSSIEEENTLINQKAENYPIPFDFFLYPGYHHFTSYFSVDFSSLQLNDGSEWVIAYSDRRTSAYWASNERVVIYPNPDLFSLYDYTLLNLERSEVISVSLGEKGPFIGGLHTLYIISYDYYSGTLYLSDGSIWQIAPGHSFSTVSNWLLSDCVIIGLNNNYFSDSYPAILINFTTTEFAVARRK